MWKQTCLGHLVGDSEVIVYYGAVLKNAATKPLSGSSDFSTLVGWCVCVFCLLGLVMLDRW